MAEMPLTVPPAESGQPTQLTSVDRIPLSLQQDFLREMNHDQESGPFGPRYTIVGGWRLLGELDLDTLRAALFDVVVRHESLRTCIDADDRDPMASAGVVDSQSVPGAATVGKTSRGYDAGKKVNGRKRHLVVDTGGLLIVVLVTAASVQDRDGGVRVLDRAKMAMPSLVLIWADAAYSRRVQDFAACALGIAVQVVAKLVGQSGFVPLPRRWVVERTHAWITGHRRMSRDYERLPAHSEAMIKWAMIGLMARRLAPAPGRRPWQSQATA